MNEDEKDRSRSTWDERADRWEESANRWEERWRHRMNQRSKYGHVWTGGFIILLGVAALIHIANPQLPNWLFSWKTFLIALGLYSGLKYNFRGGFWFILILVGSLFLVKDVAPQVSIKPYIWPIVLIVVGGAIMLRPKNRMAWVCGDEEKKKDSNSNIEDASVVDETTESREDFISSHAIFGGAKKSVISKNFKGGELTNIFGGTELNLFRSDFTGTATIQVTNIFGGTTLIVPADWEVQSDAVMIFGGLEDKRNVQPTADGSQKRLILKGTIFFGGVQVKNF